MLKLKLLKTKQEFEGLKKNDLIIVAWADYFVRHHPNSSKIMSYKIAENRTRSEEIICRVRGNHFFNYDMHLQGLSNAKEVYQVIEL